LKELWQAAFGELGHNVEFHPSFDPVTWTGGFLPVKFTVLPNDQDDFAERYGEAPMVAGFELALTKTSATFRTSMGRTTADFRAQCLAAATLAMVTAGTYRDPQSGQKGTGSEAVVPACEQISEFESSASESEWSNSRFVEWN
jgi:hypothetical protein